MTRIASRLTKRIELQSLAETSDGGGGYSSVWTTIATLAAEARPIRGREIFASEKLTPVNDYIFVIRYYSGLNPKMRVKFGSRFFNIKAIVNPSEKSELLEIYCEEHLAD